jgi:hypothetical protein
VPAIVDALVPEKILCLVYRKDKFHAKCYLTHGCSKVVGSFGLVGSSTRSVNSLFVGNRYQNRVRFPESSG